MALNERQQLFVQEYLIDFHAANAYRRAGYAARTNNAAYVSAHKLLNSAKIQEALRDARAVRAQRVSQQLDMVTLRADDVVRELIIVGLSTMRDILDFSGDRIVYKRAKDIPDHAIDAIESYTEDEQTTVDAMGREHTRRRRKVKLWNKLQALDKLGKHLGLFLEREPLDVLLSRLPRELGDRLRQLLLDKLRAEREQAGPGG
jgi:phage terminase small subunit